MYKYMISEGRGYVVIKNISKFDMKLNSIVNLTSKITSELEEIISHPENYNKDIYDLLLKKIKIYPTQLSIFKMVLVLRQDWD